MLSYLQLSQLASPEVKDIFSAEVFARRADGLFINPLVDSFSPKSVQYAILFAYSFEYISFGDSFTQGTFDISIF